MSEDEWINLDHIRSFQYEKDPLLVAVTWSDGSRTIYRGEKAAYLLATWIKVVEVDKNNRAKNHHEHD
ncbi:MAG: hypothetical protein KME01_14390 [Chroococcus sp. CMT-3BRIN-NPC107]|nr:hypothetical protein [Chroococcus sp. CMT-3BRIN-NPC107]